MDYVDGDGADAVDGFLQSDAVQALLEDPDVSLRLLTLSGKYLFVGRGVKKLTGYDPKEFVRMNAFELVHPEDMHVVNEARTAIEEGPVEMIVRARHKDGHFHWVSTRMMLEQGLVSVAVMPTTEPPGGAMWAPTDPFV